MFEIPVNGVWRTFVRKKPRPDDVFARGVRRNQGIHTSFWGPFAPPNFLAEAMTQFFLDAKLGLSTAVHGLFACARYSELELYLFYFGGNVNYQIRNVLPCLLLLLVLGFATTACSEKNFSAVEGSEDTLGGITPAGGNGDILANCADVLRQVTVPVKVLFVVDASGSNVPNIKGPATDPDKSLRGTAIQSFFDAYKALTNFAWGFLVFQDERSYSILNAGMGKTFSTSATQMQSAVDMFYSSVVDEKGTPYLAALERASRSIRDDLDRTPETKYIVAFISDGIPDPEVAVDTLKEAVGGLMNLVPGQISFNTVYYGPQNPAAVERLSEMAKTGQGRFLDANQGSGVKLDIQSVVTVPGTNCAP